MAYANIVDTLTHKLQLSHTPVALAFLKEAPQGIEHYDEAVPSACSFWKAAERNLFYATASDHYNCPIGAITQGFKIPQPVVQNAHSLIEMMGKLSYLAAAEANSVPVVEKEHEVIVYGPLKQFEQIVPDVVLLICTPLQAMMLSEAGGIAAWGGPTESRTLGRPACAVIPASLKSGATSVSVACMGARTFADIKEEELLVAIPASALVTIERQLPIIFDANVSMKDFYRTHKSNFASV